MKDSEFYKKDFIGLRKMNEEGRVKFALFNAEHVKYSENEFVTHIVSFLKDDGDKK